MKRLALVVFMLSAMALAGCGSSGGSSTDCTAGEEAASAAFDDFATILEDNDLAPCLALTATTCDCPNGGSVTVNVTAFTVTLNNCTSATNEVYNGTMSMSQDMTSISADFDRFDGCTNVTATNVVIEGGCSGTISGTCGGQTLTCTMSESGGECMPGDCTC